MADDGTANAVSYKMGLWQGCANSDCGGYSCSAEGGSCSQQQAAQAFMTLACIISPFAVACLIFVAITNKFDLPFLWVGKGLAGVSFVFGLIGMAVGINFAINGTGYSLGLGPAAIVSIIAVILNLAAAIIGGLVREEQ
jgi:hypothetical protein